MSILIGVQAKEGAVFVSDYTPQREGKKPRISHLLHLTESNGEALLKSGIYFGTICELPILVTSNIDKKHLSEFPDIFDLLTDPFFSGLNLDANYEPLSEFKRKLQNIPHELKDKYNAVGLYLRSTVSINEDVGVLRLSEKSLPDILRISHSRVLDKQPFMVIGQKSTFYSSEYLFKMLHGNSPTSLPSIEDALELAATAMNIAFDKGRNIHSGYQVVVAERINGSNRIKTAMNPSANYIDTSSIQYLCPRFERTLN